MTTKFIPNDGSVYNLINEGKPPVIFVLTRSEYELLEPCIPSRKNDWWADSSRLEYTTDGQELLVYREGWELEMAVNDPGALIFFGKKEIGGLTITSAKTILNQVNRLKTEYLITALTKKK